MVTDSQQYEAEFPTVHEVASGEHDTLAVLYGHSQQNHYNALAFQVVRRVRRIEYVEDILNGQLGDDTSENFGYIGESGWSNNVSSAGDGLLEILENRDSTLGEYGVGVVQDGVYVGVQTGDGDAVNGLREGSDRDRGFGPDDFEQYGALLSDYTTIETPSGTQDREYPTTALSPTSDQGLLRIDSDIGGPNRMFFAFRNISGSAVNIDLVVHGYTYEVRPIMDPGTVEDIVVGDGYPDRRLLTYGGFGNSNPNLPSAWYDGEIEVEEGQLTPGGEV